MAGEMSGYYDRQGKRIDMLAWANKFEDDGYKIVARHEDDRILISTVWLGLDHNGVRVPAGTPLIFETMVFVHGDIDPKYDNLAWRWSTEKEAKEAHEIIVNCYQENQDPEKVIDEWIKNPIA